MEYRKIRRLQIAILAGVVLAIVCYVVYNQTATRYEKKLNKVLEQERNEYWDKIGVLEKNVVELQEELAQHREAIVPKERLAEDLTQVRDTVREIIDRIKQEGEAAVRYYSEKFDSWSPQSFKVTEEDVRSAKEKLPTTMVEDIDYCQARIRNFAEEQMKRLMDFEVETEPGVWLGQKIIPVASSGSYVPGGRYFCLAAVVAGPESAVFISWTGVGRSCSVAWV